MAIYDLIPTNGRKSFYGKARVIVDIDGTETLQSYTTNVARRNPDGTISRLCDVGKISVTTATHIKSFCGLCKAQFVSLPLAE